MSRVAWIGQSATARSSNVDSLRLLNGYAEIVESRQGKTVVAIYGTPGLKLFTTVTGLNGIRTIFVSANGRVFVVRGNKFLELGSTGSAFQWGGLYTVAGPVGMAENNTQILLLDGNKAHTFTFADNVFTEVISGNFPGANRVNYLDGYFVFPHLNSQRFGWTNLQSTTFDPLNFATAEGKPDLLVSQIVLHRELWNFGTLTTEPWISSGDSNEPFLRNQSGFLEQGCAAAHSPAVVGDTICWLARTTEGQGIVLQTSGYNPQRISTHPIEHAIQGYPFLDDAIGWGQQQQGHTFYWLTFPTANATWVYDVSTGLWHERGYKDPATGIIGRHRANCYAFAFGKHLVGDWENGNIYELHPTTYSDNGAAIVFDAVMPPFVDGENLGRIRHDHMQVDADVGVGLDGGAIPGTNPQILLRLSNDGGKTWPVERAKSLGKIGQTRHSVEWYQLGSSYNRRVGIRITDPVSRVIMGAVSTWGVLG